MHIGKQSLKEVKRMSELINTIEFIVNGPNEKTNEKVKNNDNKNQQKKVLILKMQLF